MTTLRAFAKVNLTLRVRRRDATGLHPLRSLAQSVDAFDTVAVSVVDDDGLEVTGGDEVERDERNLAWRGAAAMRDRLGRAERLLVRLDKRLPVAAGLGGGSADAAAGLVAAAGALGGSRAMVEELAGDLGADVPFCVTGGTLWMEGHGTELRRDPRALDYHLALATAPFALGTAAVFAAWDRLEPVGPGVSGPSLPPSLRDLEPLVNDLEPAALSLLPDLGDWMEDVSRAWGQRVLLTGSGPTVFGFFAGREEADDAAAIVAAARFSGGVSPIDRGWDGDPGGTLPPPPWGVV